MVNNRGRLEVDPGPEAGDHSLIVESLLERDLKSLIQSLDVSYLLHATEDANTVGSAVTDLLGIEIHPEVEELKGHFGNVIIKVSFRLHGTDATKSFENVSSKLPRSLKNDIVDQIDQLLDEHASLFLRLDKQKLVRGELALGTQDAIRLKVKPRGFLVGRQVEGFFASLLEGR
jgi:RNA binding exosome subunit